MHADPATNDLLMQLISHRAKAHHSHLFAFDRKRGDDEDPSDISCRGSQKRSIVNRQRPGNRSLPGKTTRLISDDHDKSL